MELNAKDIIKAMECCYTDDGSCLNCPCIDDYNSCVGLSKNALALIKQLTEENERLLARNFDLAEKGEKVVIAYKKLSEENEQWRKDWSDNQRRWESAYDILDGEKHDLEYTLLGVMHSVDKWLDGAELEQDEVNRAATMREKTLQIVEQLAEKVADLKAIAEQYQKQFEEAKADTVREMQERLKERFSTETRYTKYSGAGVVMVIDQVAKEMLEGDCGAN